MLARAHGAHEVTLHLAAEVSQGTDKVPIGGIDEPEIGQRKIELDLRMREGEINLIGGLMKEEETRRSQVLPGSGRSLS
jgi:general secretion pathway protein D